MARDRLADELEGPFHPELWGALKTCGTCERMQSEPARCLYRERTCAPEQLACSDYIDRYQDGD